MALQIPTTAEMQNLYAMHSFVRPSAPQIHPHDSTKTRYFLSGLIQARMAPAKIDSLADDVKPPGLLEQISGLTARVDELVAQNKALLVRIAELEAKRGKPPKTPDNSSLCHAGSRHRRCEDFAG